MQSSLSKQQEVVYYTFHKGDWCRVFDVSTANLMVCLLPDYLVTTFRCDPFGYAVNLKNGQVLKNRADLPNEISENLDKMYPTVGQK
jgi:hypothetical protein